MLFAVLLIFFCTKCRGEQLKSPIIHGSLDLEMIKSEIFTLEDFDYNNTTDSDLECSRQLVAIGKGIKNLEPWALKSVADAWGKMPSGIMEGNWFELGSSSQCFHVKLNGDPYKTKYCTGQFELNSNSSISDVEWNPTSSGVVNLQKTPPISFGACFPAACSEDFLRKFFERNVTRITRIPFRLGKNSCQNEEYVSDWATLEWITTGFFTIIVLLILMSTSHDIYCTVYKRNTSPVLLAFSFYSNGKRLLSYKKSKSSNVIHCLDGIRALSTQWVMFGHSFQIHWGLPVRNESDVIAFPSSYFSPIPCMAVFAIDTFLVMTGFLVTTKLLQHFEKTKGRINAPLLYFHRYLRLTPIFAVCILFKMTIYRFLGSGPLWPAMVNESIACKKSWWVYLLYVQNYYSSNDIKLCHSYSWYLAVDMQLFLISPLIVYLIYRFKAKAIYAFFILILGCVFCTVAIFVKYEFTNIVFRPKVGQFRTAYTPTHIWYSSWLIGVIFGYIFLKTRNKSIRIPKTFNLVAWLFSLAIMAGVIFGSYPLLQLNSTNTPLEFGLSDALSRVGWSIALCYIIFACEHGFGGPVNSFLSHPLWKPLSRLSYSIYLLHNLVNHFMIYSLKIPPYFSIFSVFHGYLGTSVLVTFVSLMVSLAFESPIIIFEKMIFNPKKKTAKLAKNSANEITEI